MSNRKQAHYTESMKRNVVAAARSGISQNSIARRLGIPGTTVNQWVRSAKYSDVAAAPIEVLKSLPPDPNSLVPAHAGGQKMVRVDASPAMAAAPCNGGKPMKIAFGKLTFESDGFTPEDIAMIVRALGDAHVL